MHPNLPKITDANIFHATEGILTEHHLCAWHSPGCKKHKATSLAPRSLDSVPWWLWVLLTAGIEQGVMDGQIQDWDD